MEIILIIKNDCRPLTALMYGWSKYGGSNFGLVQEDISSEWECQTCGNRSSDEAFDFEFAPREFIKICYLCQRISQRYNVTTFNDLIELVRAKHSVVEYLLELDA